MVSGTISLPLRGTFHLSLTVLVHYRSPLVFSLAGWSPRIRSGFHVSGSTQVHLREATTLSSTGLLPAAAGLSSPLRLARDFVTLAGPGTVRKRCPTTPDMQRIPAYTYQVWAISPFVRHYSGNRDFLSFPPGTQMCHFPGFPPHTLCVQVWVTGSYARWVPPFGDPCFKARLRLHTAYRSLPRPSSAFGAKTSAIRPYYLDGIIIALCGFQKPSLYLSAGIA